MLLGACKHGDENNGGNEQLPDPPPVNMFAKLAGTWRIESLNEFPSDDGLPPLDTNRFDGYRLNVKADGSFTVTGYNGTTDFSYSGTVENTSASYFRFTHTMGETTVTSQAYLYPEYDRLSFSSIVFDGGEYYGNYSSCMCVRAGM